MVEPYGWEWGFESFYDGAPYLRSRNNPTTLVASEDPGITFSVAWGDKKANLDVISGTYRETTGAGQFVEYTFISERIDLVSVLYDTNGGVQAQVVSGLVNTPNLDQIFFMSEVGGRFLSLSNIKNELNPNNVPA